MQLVLRECQFGRGIPYRHIQNFKHSRSNEDPNALYRNPLHKCQKKLMYCILRCSSYVHQISNSYLSSRICLFASCPKSNVFSFLFQAGRNIRDLFEDLRDGHNLLSLLEVLSGEILVSFESSYPFLQGTVTNSDKLGA